MGLVSSLIEGVDEVYRGLRDYFMASTGAYCDLETAPSGDDYVLICNDGSCVSLLSWHGTHRMVGHEEFIQNIEALSRQLGSVFSRPGHAMQVTFGCDRDPKLGSEMLDQYFSGMYGAARRLRLDLKDVIDDRKRALSAHCAPEYCYVALVTRPSLLPPAEMSRAREREREESKNVPKGKFAQSYFRRSQVLVDAHRAFVEFFQRDIKQRQIGVELLDARSALRVIRTLIDPDFTADDWSPTLPGDPLVPRAPLFAGTRDLSHILWPALSDQLIPREPQREDFRSVRIGDRVWAPIVVEVPQKTPQPFQDLFSRMRNIAAPWRLSMTISGAGLSENAFARNMSGILTIGSSTNGHISEAFRGLADRESRGEAVVSLRMVGATWAPFGERRLLAERASRFAKALQGWGGCEVTEVTGAPTEGVLSTVPGLRLRSIARPSNPPLADALALLPWGRPASPWKQPNFLFRTPDGKPFPYAAYSGLQDAWISLIFSPMGGGKSVLLNGLNLGLVLDPANDALPLIRILDVGPSSSGLTSLLQSALPPGMEYEAQYHRIRNTHEYAVNPCDTPLGVRFPLAAHRDFLISLLCLLATPLDREDPQDGVAAIAGLAIDLAFHRFSDDQTASPRKYAVSASPIVDSAITRHGIAIDENTTWWELEDQFHKLGDIRAAYAAHRLAMPLIADIGACAKDDSIVKLYPDRAGEGGIPLPDFFRRKISEAHNQYQILQRHTRFELGDASIVALDLDEVAKRGSSAAKRQTTVMYLTALWMLSSDFFIGEEILPDIPEAYRPYHASRVVRLARVKKRLCADEFHRPAESSAMAVGVIEQIIREGRKWKVDVVLASQRAGDFPKTMIDLASCVYIMRAPQTGAAGLKDLFQLSESEIHAIDNVLHGPVAGVGANLLAKFVTKRGNYSHLLTNTGGPVEMWGFSTTSEDRDLRNALYKEFPSSLARRVLARRFPAQAKDEIDVRAAARSRSAQQFEKGVFDEVLDEVRALCKREQESG